MKLSKKYEPFVGVMGNIFEWYNFALFMPFLPVISKQFFPTENSAIGHTITLLVMSVGLFARPLGAAIFGPIGDKFGRANAISWSLLLMAFSTFGMALLPGYNSIGIAAPILLTLFRALQGVSMGGEFTAAMVHLVEDAPPNHRGFLGCFTDIGIQVGVLFGGQSLVWLCTFFSNEDVYSYAWRIPFLFSLILVPFAYLLPHNIPEKKKTKKSIISMLMEHKKEVLCVFFMTSFCGVGFYTLLTLLPYYLHSIDVLSLDAAAKCTNTANIAMIITILIGGYWGDRLSRKPFLISGIVGSCITIAVMLTSSCTSFSFWLVMNGICGTCLGLYYSNRSSFFSEAFPREIRCTGVSVSLSVGQSIFGGLSPAVTLRLLHISNTYAIIPIVCVSLIALYSLSRLPDRSHDKSIG